MSYSNYPNIVASGVPLKNLVFCLDDRDGTYKGLSLGIFTSGINYITGSSIQSFGVATTGTRRLDNIVCKRAVFINQRSPQYRVYKNDETGNTAYLNWMPVNSGGWQNRLEIDGISNLQDIAVQTDSTSVSSFSGNVLIYK